LTHSFESLSFFALFNALADAMLLVSKDGRVVLANDPALQMFAYTADEIAGIRVEMLMPQSYRQHHTHLRNHFFSKPGKRSMGNGKNLVVLTQHGQELPVDIGLSPIVCEDKEYVLVSFHATEKQILAEASLKASEERLRLAKLSAGLGVFDIDLLHNTVTYDTHIQDFFDFPHDNELTYKQFVAAIDPADQAGWEAVFNRAIKIESDSVYQVEFRINTGANKPKRWLHAAGKVFFNDHVAIRMLGVVKDITAHTLMQQELRKQQIDLEALAKTQIAIQTASAIAHEINQPLAAISAYSEVALYAIKAESMDMDRLNRSLLGCVTQAQRAGKSLHELMEFFQKGEIEASPIDLHGVLREAINITQHSGYGGFQSSLHLEPGLPLVLANRTQLQKVIVNILRNGIEAAHLAGIPVAKIQVLLRTHSQSNMAEVIIQDNGPGLTPEVQQRIFEPFFTTKSQGIGMGLTVSRSLIEASGGQLWFDANANAGASFHLTLPFANLAG
jgi:two-component system, LuxR family, sensor kinase FixL